MAGVAGSACFQALEEQLALLRWLATPAAEALYRQYGRSHPRLTVEDFGGATAYALEHGAPYYWPPGFCRMLEEVAATLPGHWAPAESTFHSASGFMWFARPLALPAWSPEEVLPLVAASWSLSAPPVTPPEVFVTIYTADPRLRAAGVPTTAFGWRLGRTIDQILPILQHQTQNPARTAAKLRLVAAAWAFLEQRLVTTQVARPPRAVRRRVASLRADPLVHVVVLRRASPHPTAGAGRPEVVEWTCQWIVRGHWRDQWFPAHGRHQPIWILPHVKGPEEKPLKPAATKLFAVLR
jgi:hypothetical protein